MPDPEFEAPSDLHGAILDGLRRVGAVIRAQRLGLVVVGLALGALIGAVLLVLWTLGGLLDSIDGFWQQRDWPEVLTGAVVIASVLLISAIIDIPAALYRTFVIEERFGFNRLTMSTFWADRLKGLALAMLLGIPLLLLILWLMQTAGVWWWLYAWAALSLFSILVSWAYPKFIAPLFNRFETLDDGEVAEGDTWSIELCGGTHVARTGDIGVFVALGDSASSAGVRRIEAITGQAARRERTMDRMRSRFMMMV